ncbi:hypothetical protein NBM05_14915 [Rothia sp. AR01]|uniref:Uncharacterized protein n=1 Tax=Rothia santali TaxID=2949643 RepID=A0A9X2HK90_9MICC|nr:hypothetical protein [Rothia santali]MCP3427261.1 hypothetical protein [Rothia santali]
MSSFSKGQKVMPTRELGGFFRDPVPKGATGVVVESPFLSQAQVHFQWSGVFFGGEATVTVDDDEIAPC